MFYDLNVPYSTNDPELPRTISFLAELSYTTLALSTTLTGKLPTPLPTAPPLKPSFATPPHLKILNRCTFLLSDPSQNHRLSSLLPHYSLLAIRPTNEKSLQQACSTLECDLISLDLSQRLPYHFKHKTLSAAIARGIRFEICYAAALHAPGVDLVAARRNLITNATALIRTTRGRGIIISSEARVALGCRGPWDVVNLAAVWGLGQERGKEAVCEEARKVVIRAGMMRQSWRGVVEVKFEGDLPTHVDIEKKQKGKASVAVTGSKRKAVGVEKPHPEGVEQPISNRERKRRAKKARLEAATADEGPPSTPGAMESTATNLDTQMVTDSGG